MKVNYDPLSVFLPSLYALKRKLFSLREMENFDAIFLERITFMALINCSPRDHFPGRPGRNMVLLQYGDQ